MKRKLAPKLAANKIIRRAIHPKSADPKTVNKDANGRENVTIKR